MLSTPTVMLHHIALGARDVATVARFYAAAFNLRVLQEHQDDKGGLRSIWLDLGGTILMVERTESPALGVEGVGAGPFLLAFRVDAAARDATEAHLIKLGASIEARTAATSYARDPEGNRIAISHYPEPKRSAEPIKP